MDPSFLRADYNNPRYGAWRRQRGGFSVDASAVAADDCDGVPCAVPGKVEVQVGSSSADIRLKGAITASGARRVTHIRDWRPCGVRIRSSIG
jgi:hypothetical protein